MDAKVVLEKRPVKTKFIWNISVYDLPFVIMLVMDGFLQVIEVTAMGAGSSCFLELLRE